MTSLRPAASRRSRTPAADTACVQAVELALQAARETARPSEVGDHLGWAVEGDRVVTHYFACRDAGYRGWRWAITVTRASRAKNVTISETALVPGDEAILPPPWVPWLERLRPGDMGPGDLLPTAEDDVRLAPGFTETDDVDADVEAQWELGLGRARVLSVEGRAQAAERWYDGTAGPRAPIAAAAPAQCSTCGFFIPLSGELRLLFGVCANAYVPDDGRVVAADHGCGGHSEAVKAPAQSDPPPLILDDLTIDPFTTTPHTSPATEAPAQADRVADADDAEATDGPEQPAASQAAEQPAEPDLTEDTEGSASAAASQAVENAAEADFADDGDEPSGPASPQAVEIAVEADFADGGDEPSGPAGSQAQIDGVEQGVAEVAEASVQAAAPQVSAEGVARPDAAEGVAGPDAAGVAEGVEVSAGDVGVAGVAEGAGEVPEGGEVRAEGGVELGAVGSDDDAGVQVEDGAEGVGGEEGVGVEVVVEGEGAGGGEEGAGLGEGG
ncbi:DUF3027 domain-containing protein [Actinocorallia sp. API 0066]|uniref:DUF3027 domain-containing protein n=1 Tax=Actinocorallia sp. API 0066 TaxID=2896846 RepID=UPI0027E086E2|nr:DUF3027 domain-containing protein [Actinocorallia sp. API 0066]